MRVQILWLSELECDRPKIAEHLQERGEGHRGMKNGADCPNMEKGEMCMTLENRGITSLSHMRKFQERIVEGRIRAIV